MRRSDRSRRRRPPLQAPEKRSLYERLGGAYRIATLVDDFIDRIIADSRLNENPRVREASERLSKAGLKYLVTEMMCWAAGGPQVYTGRSMAESHRHLAITDAEWRWFMEDFERTLDACRVHAPERGELTAMFERAKSTIVVP